MATEQPRRPMASERLEPNELFRGMLVHWMHTPRGGYGFTIAIEARVVELSLSGDRVTIEVATKTGAVVKRMVKCETLRSRNKVVAGTPLPLPMAERVVCDGE